MVGYLVPWTEFGRSTGSSAFTFEDLPSDYWGTVFGAGLGSAFRQGMDLQDQVTNFFTEDMGGVLNPNQTPDFASLPLNELEHQVQWQTWQTAFWRGFWSFLVDVFNAVVEVSIQIGPV